MKLTLVQLNSTDSLESNLNTIIYLIEQHLQNSNSKFFILPENSLFFRINSALVVLSLESSQIKELQKFARLKKIYIHLTTALEIDKKNWNASILISPHEIKVLYKKIHLFDIQLNNRPAVKESDFFFHGNQVTQFNFEGYTWGSSICYDLRFSELYLQHAKKQVDIILVPSAFLVETGKAHWEVLLRARAVECQAYVLAPAQWGEHISTLDSDKKRSTYGHTMAISPWGEIIAQIKAGIGCIDVEIFRDEIKSVREQIPMGSHRRL